MADAAENPRRRGWAQWGGWQKISAVLGILVGIVVMVSGLSQIREGLSGHAAAAGDPGVKAASEKASAASQQFVAMTKDVYQTGKAPGQADAAAAPLLDAVYGTGAIEGKAATTKDLTPLVNWMLADNKVGYVYLYAGTGIADPNKTQVDQNTEAKLEQNVAKYPAEVGRYMDTEVLLSGAISAAMARDTSMPDSARAKDGKARMRAGMLATVGGSIQTLAVSGVTDAWRRQRLVAFDHAAPALAKFLTPADCKQLSDIAASVSAGFSDGGLKTGLATFTSLQCSGA